MVQADRGSAPFPTGRTFVCLLFTLRHMQIWPKLQVWSPNGNLRLQHICTTFGWRLRTASFGFVIIGNRCVKFIIRRAKEGFNIRDKTCSFWWWWGIMMMSLGNGSSEFYKFFSGGKRVICKLIFPLLEMYRVQSTDFMSTWFYQSFYLKQLTSSAVLDFLLPYCIKFTNICHIGEKSNVNISSVLKPVYLFEVFPICKKIKIKNLFGNVRW